MQEKMIRIFHKIFGSDENIRLFFAPGRVNLIGEHTDYNGGYVLPCSLTIGTYAAVKKRKDRKMRFYSENFPELGVTEVSLDQIEFDEEHDWVNYPKGIVSIFLEEGKLIERGFDIVYYGNIPNGAGLSSSASIELLTCVVINGLFNLGVEMDEMVDMSQRTENDYIGVKCGVMDQFAIGMGKQDHAILLNTSTMVYKYAELKLNNYVLIISNTNKRRGLADSKYNERYEECRGALKALEKVTPISALCDLSIESFEEHKESIPNLTYRKRAKHVVYENQRTLLAYDYLNQGRLEAFGKLMNASHTSLKEDYEVTGLELDTLVKLAQNTQGVIGSRMTGAGFGGCTVSIVKKAFVDHFVKTVKSAYTKKIGYEPDFYIVEVGNGAGEI